MFLCKFCFQITRHQLRGTIAKVGLSLVHNTRVGLGVCSGTRTGFTASNRSISSTTNTKAPSFQNKVPKSCKRLFRTTSSTKALPPFVCMVVRGVLKVGAVLTGRGLRKWWIELPNTKKQEILNKLVENRRSFAIGGFVSGGMLYVYYVSHLVEDPITKRKKFLIFSEKQIVQLANVQCDAVLKFYRKRIVTSGKQYDRVRSIFNRILRSNHHLPGTNKVWRVFIVDDNDTRNAFVLPNGSIFVFTGMLTAVSNDDQLAVVLAHELAHVFLRHTAELVSKAHFFETMLLIPLIALFMLLPDIIALSSYFLTDFICRVLFQLPMSRQLETEADVVGLEMTARACYDPRQAVAFWTKMEKLAEKKEIEWLSTHPTHKKRRQAVGELMPEAIRTFALHCPTLGVDPLLPR